jgi:DivIVA domain-containing protein
MRDKSKQEEGSSFSASPASPRIVTPLEIQQKEFTVSRFGGYKMREVDEFLDELTESVQALNADIERLRRQAGAPPVVGAPDLDDVSRQADEIIQRARDEAAVILAEAKEKAASAAGAAAAAATAAVSSEEERAAVNAFLQQEKEFLQSLAELVQGHAGSVKQMAKKARSASTAGRRAEPGTEEQAAARAEPEPEPEAVATSEPEPGAVQGTAEPSEPGGGPEAVVLEEPEPATAKRTDEAAGEDGSLRELFWGEEN